MRAALQRGVIFLLVGTANTAFGYLCYAALVLLGLPLWAAVIATLGISMVFNFHSYGALVFANAERSAMPGFFMLYALIGSVNYGLLYALTKAGVGPLLAQAIILPVLAFMGYFGMSIFVFGKVANKELQDSGDDKGSGENK
jgi:putative flippase GtrA